MSLEEEIKTLSDNIKELITTLKNFQTVPIYETVSKNAMLQETRLIPVTKWNMYHQYPSQSGLRWLIFNEKQNGFNDVVKRIGRRVLIDEKKFFEWATKNPV